MTAHSKPVCLEHLRRTDMQGLNDELTEIGKSLTEAIGIENITIRWCNIRNQNDNPDGFVGQFVVIDRSKP